MTRPMQGLCLGFLLILAWPLSALAQPAADSPAARCSSLATADFAGVPDAPTRVTSASLIAATASDPAYCKITGVIAPQVGVELRLPATTWNGKFMEVGCGGNRK